LIVGLQTDTSRISTYRKTHKVGVFDAYTPEIRRACRAHIVTSLPDAYGRGRIIGDYRLALYGVHRLIAPKRAERHLLDAAHSTADIIRDREELAEQIRALGELAEMAAAYGADITRPAATAQEAIQWLYFGYLAAVEEQNRAVLSLGRTSTFLDIYVQRDLGAGVLTESRAQELVDDLVSKLRIIRCRRTTTYNELFAGDPTWVTESIGGMGEDGRSLVTRTSFRYVQTLYNLGPAPETNLTVLWSPHLPAGFKRYCAQVSIDTSSIRYENDELRRTSLGDDPAIMARVSAVQVGRQMRFFGARVNLAKTLLYAINGGVDEMSGEQIGPAEQAITSEYLDYDEVRARLDTMMDWLAETYVNALNCVHYMQDKYAYERVEMALHDYSTRRTMACGIAGLSVAADSLSAIKHTRVKVIRDENGLAVDYETAGSYPADGNNDDRAAPPDERPGCSPAGRRRPVGGEAAVRDDAGRHLPHRIGVRRRTWPDVGGANRQPRRSAGRLHRIEWVPPQRQRAEPRDAAGRDGTSGAPPATNHPGFRLRRALRPVDPRAAARRGQPDLPPFAVTAYFGCCGHAAGHGPAVGSWPACVGDVYL
jgi:formate C-acetyltransferase